MTTENKTDLEVIGKLIVAFHNDYTISQACRYAGIARDTYYRWLKEKEGFADEMEDAQNKLLTVAGEYINQFLADKDTSLSDKVGVAITLKKLRDPRYKSKVEATINPDEQKLEDVIKEVADDPGNRLDNLHDDSPDAASESSDQDSQDT